MSNDTKTKRKSKTPDSDRSATDELADSLVGMPAGLAGSPDDRRSFAGSPDDR